MASLECLPEHLIGLLYGLLPDASSKKAFFSSAHVIHDAPSVLHQVDTLVVPTKHFYTGNRGQGPAHRSLAFPRAAQLRKLIFKGTTWCSGASTEKPDDCQVIMTLLRPDDEGMHCKLQQVTHLTLHECRIESDHGAGHLGQVIGLLPHLKGLTLSGQTTSHAALLQSLSRASNSLSLRELHCTELDVPGLQAVGCLRGLESLSFHVSYLHPSDSLMLQPLSCLSALKHLAFDYAADYQSLSFGDVLPHLRSLRSLKMLALCPHSLLSAMPPLLEKIHLECMDVLDLCGHLEAFASGQSLPALCQLHIEQLQFGDCAGIALSTIHGHGLSAASCLSALPSFLLTVDSVDASPGLRTLFEFLEPLPIVAQGMKSVTMDCLSLGDDVQVSATIVPTDLARLAQQCPNLEGLDMNNVLFQDMLVSLCEVASSFPCLSRCGVAVMIGEQPGYAGIFMAFFAGLALNREMLAKSVRFHAWLGVDMVHDGEQIEEWAAEQLYACAIRATKDLQRSWEQLSAWLPGKARDVVFDYYVDNFS